ncbi:hypothetical protein PC9H_003341 [Pleurotus ostreatus]|uniref:DUF605-domain-containing protein n=2 Tax=Pleurotus TaxID=5320 RepID=A0A8H7DWE1_PLEOS|nr:uncharacterized protein PC9H_003341 [Pleurotus ostreatus]KAF7436508.1 hypothetical protein PC9H_003341 [Pleurotus ostreatus]KAG9222511.1 hypothetical protein CCMSSC00406_0002846 [Pleurotus cornucopiae]
MAAPRLLNLPPISPALKSITPFLQRAEELRTKEPIMAYWCSYHAAQVGISLKAKDAASRNLLFELLGVLETMKKEIGPHDAIDVEAASAAYVENFGLKIFAVADNEDRRGAATRSTAKKFLAASNFLEVLRVFPKTEIPDSIEEKIKYAKWKAVDITKAFKEGRKPTPGPAGAPASPTEDEPLLMVAPPSTSSTLSAEEPPPAPDHRQVSSPPQSSPPLSARRVSPSPPRMDPVDIAKANLPHTPLKSNSLLGVFVPPGEGDTTPGSWSTAATPGNEVVHSGQDSPYSAGYISPKGSPRHIKQSSMSSGEDDLLHSLRSLPQADASKKAVHFISSVPDDSPISTRQNILHRANIPPSLVPDSGVDLTLGATTISPVIPPPPPPFQTPPDPVSPTVYRRRVEHQSPLSYPPMTLPSAQSQTHYVPRSSGSPIPPDPVVLTPSVIAKAQKHCRFAISALDYEDAAQARKELRTALAILGDS